MTRPTISMADTAPRAAPRRTSSCFIDRGLAGADGARATSAVPKRSTWPSGLEYITRVMPGEFPIATAEATGANSMGLGSWGAGGEQRP